MKGSVELLSRVDHLLYATPDLNRGVEEIEELIGVVATAGGQHPGLGTRNALIALGPAAYLEIIAPDGPIATGTPPGHWIAIVSQIARNDELSLAAAAEAYARVGIAVHDAFISCWSAKYIYNLQRPVTYIIENIDAGWLPFIGTPAFPAYTSGHSTQSGAAAWVLTDMFGTKSFTDTTHTDHGLVPPQEPRTFASFDEAAAEAAISRLYGGIHFSFDNAEGLAAGQCTGQAIHDRVRFKRHHHDR